MTSITASKGWLFFFFLRESALESGFGDYTSVISTQERMFTIQILNISSVSFISHFRSRRQVRDCATKPVIFEVCRLYSEDIRLAYALRAVLLKFQGSHELVSLYSQFPA